MKQRKYFIVELKGIDEKLLFIGNEIKVQRYCTERLKQEQLQESDITDITYAEADEVEKAYIENNPITHLNRFVMEGEKSDGEVIDEKPVVKEVEVKKEEDKPKVDEVKIVEKEDKVEDKPKTNKKPTTKKEDDK